MRCSVCKARPCVHDGPKPYDVTPVNGRHWELTSYEWNPRTGIARFGYTHRWTGKHMDYIRHQPTYVPPVEQRETRRFVKEARRAA